MEGQGKASSAELLSDEKWVVALMEHLQEPMMVVEVLRWAAFVKGPPLTKERGALPTSDAYSLVFSVVAALESLKRKRVMAGLVMLPSSFPEEDRTVFYPGPFFFAEQDERALDGEALERWKRNLSTARSR